MGYQVIGLSWFWASFPLALALFLFLARRLVPKRSPKASGLSPLPTVGLLSGLVVLAVAALTAALAGIYLRFDLLGIATVDWLVPFFVVMAMVLGVLRVVWTRDFAVPLIGGYPIPGSVFQGIVLSIFFLATVGTSIHFNLAWFLPTVPRLLPIVITTPGLWVYFLQEEGIKDALARSRGLSHALVLGLGSKLIIGLVWYGTTFLPNSPSFVGITIPVAVAGLLVLESLIAVLRDWRFGSVAISTFTSVVIAWIVSVIFPLA